MAFFPYLFFGGNCREAFTRYQKIFGGELAIITAADMPEDEQMPGMAVDMVMHAALKTDDALLLGSDDPTSDSFPAVQGMRVNAAFTDPDEAVRVFNALTDGGTVQLSIGPTSFSPMFGMCLDHFGTPWMISTEAPTA